MSNDLQESKSLNAHTQHDDTYIATRAVSSTWIAPLPRPEDLRSYNEVFAGCAERIVALAEGEMQHRHNQERAETEHRRMAIQSEIDSESRGMWLAFILAVLFIGLSGFLLYMGHLGWGVGLLSADLITLAGLFIYGRNGRSAEQPYTERPNDSQQELPFPGN